MVVITIFTQKNGETIFFDEPIPQVHFMKLISCSLNNSWDTLKNEGTLSIIQQDKSISVSKGRVEKTDPRSADYPLTPAPRTTLRTTPRTTLRTTPTDYPYGLP